MEIFTLPLEKLTNDIKADVLDFFEKYRNHPQRISSPMHSNYIPEVPHSVQSLLISDKFEGCSFIKENGEIVTFCGYYSLHEFDLIMGGVRLFNAPDKLYYPPIMLNHQSSFLSPKPMVMTINLSHRRLFDIIRALSRDDPKSTNINKNKAISFYKTCTFYDDPVVINGVPQLVLSTQKINHYLLDGYHRKL